uniref:Synapse defective 1, Rho GTPase, homolog 2 n=1 Tax=Xenopus tropicalis TaxID=8364 RepID=A0A803K054_XENTR
MADPLRRTLSKLRGKRSKKGPAGGLGAECNGEGKEQRGGTYRGPAEESSGEGKPLVGCEGQSLGGQTPATSRDFMATAQIGPESTEGTLGWCSQNHNNNNDAVLGGAEVSSSDTAGFVLTNAHHSYFNGVEVRYNGVQSGHHSIPHSVSHGISRIKDNEGIFPCGKYQNCNLSPLYPPEYTSYSHSAGAEKQWVSPHSAPVSSCPLTFFYPQPPQARTVQESQTEFVPSTFIPSHSGTLGGSHMVTPEYSAPSQDYSKLVGTSFYRITQNNSEDSEEDDYYDNDNLLVPAVTEPQYNSICIGHDGLSPRSEQLNRTVSPQGDYSGYQQSKGTGNIYLETDRLRSQLQEAYYLLIHAMHDLPLENQTSKIAAKVERCPSSSQSQDSVYSQSSVRAIESDVWSSDEASPKQVSQSDLVSLNALRNLEINRFHSCSKSLDAIYTMPIQETLQKFHSDSLIKYSTLTSSVSPNCGIEDSQGSVCHQADTYMDCKGDVCPQSTTRAISSEISGVCNQTQSDYLHEGKPVYEHVTCNTVTADSQGQVLSQKPSGLTVKKMQKWMYKGRLLSLEMKDRIIGSSQRTTGSCRLTSSGTSDRPELPQTSSSASLKMPGESQGPPVTGAGVQSPIKPISPTATEFSPPSSPNPSKRAGSINWSFPDKIKSPRTVRKLSMKMKKLPELSRKRSIKGTSNADHAPSVSKSNCQDISHTASLSSSGNATAAASRNVISRYHLDSSVSSQQNYKKKNSGSSKSSSKGGYLSDGDSPELIAKSGKHGADNRATKGKEALAGSNTKSDIDIDAFRHYSFSDQPKCFQYISGLMSLHFYGAEDLKPPKIDSKDVFCAIQVDSVNKARTALLTCRTTFLDMDHTFNIELENAQHLKLVVFSWDPTPRKNRVCCHGTVVLPALFRVTKTHQLAVKLEPRGLIYVKLNLMEQWENSLDRPGVDREPIVFGVEARKVVEKENAGLMVPLLMDKCITEIEKRGCQVVGLYRLCGSAAVKKELREAFERDSKSVGLCESQYPDINVITGVLKDYLRELPSPLITKHLYEAVLKAMAEKPLKMASSGCENDSRDSENTVSLLDCLPDVEKATLKMLLDHLKLVASYHEVNKMTCQNLAVCFGPVLLSQRQETSSHNNRVFIDSEELASALDFKKHIEVLHYLLQLWPVKNASAKEPAPNSTLTEQQPCLRRKKPRPQMLNLGSSDMSGVLRPRVTRLDSPSSNRYAGDWSSCRESYLICPKDEADYDDVPSEDTDSRGDIVRSQLDDVGYQQVTKEHPLKAFVSSEGDGTEEQEVNLQDLQESIDTLIGNLELELKKNKHNAHL